MRILPIVIFSMVAGLAHAQTISTFDTLSLHGTDTEYVNYASLGRNVGFQDGLAFFPCYYDTSYGDSLWVGGFSYSNWRDSASTADWADSVVANPGKQYAAKAGTGYDGSAQYGVVYCSNPATYANVINLPLQGAAIGKPVFGFYATNTSYAYSSMKFGDMFDTMFHTGDWFLLTIKGYYGGTLKSDSVNFYLADYRSTTADSDYIVNNWQWVNLTTLGNVDSLQFSLSSSNNTSGYLDVPAYFCMDNFTTNENGLGVSNVHTYAAKLYPNPANSVLNMEDIDPLATSVSISSVSGQVLISEAVTSSSMHIDISTLAPGAYFIAISGGTNTGTAKFIKQ